MIDSTLLRNLFLSKTKNCRKLSLNLKKSVFQNCDENLEQGYILKIYLSRLGGQCRIPFFIRGSIFVADLKCLEFNFLNSLHFHFNYYWIVWETTKIINIFLTILIKYTKRFKLPSISFMNFYKTKIETSKNVSELRPADVMLRFV